MKRRRHTERIGGVTHSTILKDLHAAPQKDLPSIATMIYAALVMNLITFSKHHSAQFTSLTTYFMVVEVSSSACACLDRYAQIARMQVTIARMNEPSAAEPDE